MERMVLELEWEDDVIFKIDEVINCGWKELEKCSKVDVVSKHGRTVYAN